MSPRAIVHHKVNATIGQMSDLHVYYHARNLEFLWIKNMPTALMLRYAHHKLIQEVGSFCYLWSAALEMECFFQGKARCHSLTTQNVEQTSKGPRIPKSEQQVYSVLVDANISGRCFSTEDEAVYQGMSSLK